MDIKAQKNGRSLDSERESDVRLPNIDAAFYRGRDPITVGRPQNKSRIWDSDPLPHCPQGIGIYCRPESCLPRRHGDAQNSQQREKTRERTRYIPGLHQLSANIVGRFTGFNRITKLFSLLRGGGDCLSACVCVPCGRIQGARKTQNVFPNTRQSPVCIIQCLKSGLIVQINGQQRTLDLMATTRRIPIIKRRVGELGVQGEGV